MVTPNAVPVGSRYRHFGAKESGSQGVSPVLRCFKLKRSKGLKSCWRRNRNWWCGKNAVSKFCMYPRRRATSVSKLAEDRGLNITLLLLLGFPSAKGLSGRGAAWFMVAVGHDLHRLRFTTKCGLRWPGERQKRSGALQSEATICM